MVVSKEAPKFTAEAVMPDKSFRTLSLSDFKGKYVLLLFYPMDFTFVCPSEIIAFSNKVRDFESRNVQILGLSIDSKFSHFAWCNMPREQGGLGDINFPLVSDITHSITKSYNIEHSSGVALRGLFILDKQGIVRHATVNDLPLGRSVDEALRIIDALKFTEEHGEVCPANWRKGDPGMQPTAKGVAKYLGEMK